MCEASLSCRGNEVVEEQTHTHTHTEKDGRRALGDHVKYVEGRENNGREGEG